MIDGKTKKKLLDEIQKFGNVSSSCLKAGVDKATYYRWKKKNKKFSTEADEAEILGRGGISDIAEHGLLINIKNGNQRAIEYALNHNSERYKQKTDTNVYMNYKKDSSLPLIPQKTLEDIIDEHRETTEIRSAKLYGEAIKFVCGLPNKPDGTPISLDEILDYEAYIKDWQRVKLEEIKKSDSEPKIKLLPITDIEDSKSEQGTSPITLQENQKL